MDDRLRNDLHVVIKEYRDTSVEHHSMAMNRGHLGHSETWETCHSFFCQDEHDRVARLVKEFRLVL